MSDEWIEAIVARALGPRTPFGVRFVRLARALGWAGLLGGAGRRLIGAVVVAAVVAGGGVGAAPGSTVGMLAVGPLLLLLLTALVDGVDRIGPLTGLRRSLLFTAAEVTAVRVVGFAAAGLAFAVVAAAASARPTGATAVDLIGEACAATVAAGVLVLVLLSRGWDRAVVLLPAIWVAAVVVPGAWGPGWEAALQAVPTQAWGGIALVGLVVFGVMDGRSLRPGSGVRRAAGL